MFGRRTTETIPSAPQAPDDDLDLLFSDDTRSQAATSASAASDIARQYVPSADTYAAPLPVATVPLEQQAHIPEPTPFVPPTPASAPRQRSASESVIGPDDFFDGSYRSERGVRIQGSVKGSIESRQYIFVEASAQVEANLSAEDITISGRFHGVIECRRRLEITSSGHVEGQIRTQLLVVQEGGILHGDLHMHAPENTAPSEEQL